MKGKISVTATWPVKARGRKHEATRITTVVRGQIGGKAKIH